LLDAEAFPFDTKRLTALRVLRLVSEDMLGEGALEMLLRGQVNLI